jgi:nucleoside phosphorylase
MVVNMKKYKPYKFNEEVTIEDISVIDKYIHSLINLDKFKKKQYLSDEGNVISYFYSDRNANSYNYEIIFNNKNNEIHLVFEEVLIIPGESLADPKKAYLTTSTRTFKKQKRKLNKFYNDINKAKKDIEKFFKK